jgi:hypothetical protein
VRAALVGCLLLAACSTATPTATPTAYGGSCTSRGGLPDPACTPGEADPRVTQDNLHATICRRGYTASVRPPREVTHRIKIRLTKAYGIGSMPFSQVELDHLIPLSLGGASTDANLWPELRNGPHNVDDKDAVAVRLNRAVCSGRLGLAAAQHAISTNWETAG